MFETHKVNDNGFKEIHKFKQTMNDAVHDVIDLLPEGREKAVFKTKLEEAMFFGTKSIAGKVGNFTEIVKYTKKTEDLTPPIEE